MNKRVSRRLFVFGLGYVATAVATALKEAGWHVAGTCRGEVRRNVLEALGFDVCIFDGRKPTNKVERQIAASDHILCSIPPDEDGDPVLACYEEQICEANQIQWIGYLSTTGVYGDWGGKEVDERSPFRPKSDRVRRRVKAERAWLSLYQGVDHPVHVFRLAGIYGPNRNVINRVRAGTARRIDKAGHLFSRIHLDDIVSTLRASIASPRSGAIYNVSDNEPASQADVVAHACTLLDVPPPELVPFEKAVRSMSEMAQTFWVDNRRVSNRLLHDELGVALSHPTYREGLAALVRDAE